MDKKFVIEIKDNDVYINGVKRSYGEHEDIGVEEKIMISMADELGFEPAELLNIEVFEDEEDW